MKIIAATGNAGKVREIKKIFSDEKVEELIKSIQSYKTNRWWRRTFISQEEN